MKTVKLGDVCEVIAGQSPVGSSYNDRHKGIEFHQGKKLFGENDVKESNTYTTQPSKIAEPGDILMSVRAPVGPVNYTNRKICIGRGLAAIRVGAKIDKSYLFHFLRMNEANINGTEGATFASINKKDIESIKIPLLSLEEQRRVVERLDAAFEKIDCAIELTEKNINNSRNLYQSYLKSIFDNVPDGWTSNTLKEITTKIGSGATPTGGKKSYKNDGICLIRSMNVYDTYFKYNQLAYIDNEQARKLTNVALESGDVLLNITGASIARCNIVPEDCLPGRVNQHVSIIRLDQTKLLPGFLHYELIAESFKNLLLGIGDGAGSTRQAITKAQIQDIRVYYPSSIKQQNCVIGTIGDAIKYSSILAKKYVKKKEYLVALRQSLLIQAFPAK